jgi:alpha-galactosidase
MDGLEQLNALRRQGWHFAIWLKPETCIIQGSPDNGCGDWAFDVQAHDLQQAIQQAVEAIKEWEVRGA